MEFQDLEGLLAREAIRDLPVKYCDCVWQDDMEGLVALFSQDGRFSANVAGQESTFQGQKELLAFYKGSTSFMPRPYIHNHVVTLTGRESAIGRCYLDLRSGKNNMDWLGAGYYNDRYIKKDGEWKFESRDFVVVRMDELPEGMD